MRGQAQAGEQLLEARAPRTGFVPRGAPANPTRPLPNPALGLSRPCVPPGLSLEVAPDGRALSLLLSDGRLETVVNATLDADCAASLHAAGRHHLGVVLGDAHSTDT